jgi:hypothetical protein
MSNLLKEAIADAKAVRETALQNAKAALEEAFTPRLQSMLSQKLKEDEYEEDEVAPEEDGEELGEEDEEKPLDVEPDDEGPESGDEGEAEVPSDEGGEEAYDDGDDVGDGEEPAGDVAVEPESEEEDLDVEAIVRELEAEEDEAEEGDYEESEAEEDEEVAETIELNGQKYAVVKEEEEDDIEEEVDQSSGVGNSSEEGYEEESFDDPAKPLSISEEEAEEGEAVEEIVDLSELLDELSEEDAEESEDAVEEVKNLQSDLTEHRKVIKYLKSKLNEVNLLNAKLLFTNKLFKTYNLNNNQKLRVVETFDRAKNTREIKLIYSTLAESFAGKTSGVKVTKINESFASKPQKSTKPSKKVIAEGSDLANRFKKLAGIN